MYIPKFSHSFSFTLKKYPDELKNEVINIHINGICNESIVGKPMKYEYKGCSKIKFKYKNTSYRIIYEIINNEAHFLYLGVRDNFYRDIKNKN